MTATVDHVALPARDSATSARFLAAVLGDLPARQAGPDDDMFAVHLDGDTMLLYMDAPQTPRGHVALRIDAERFAGAVAALRERGVPFGNDPGAPENGATNDCIGTGSRLYFSDVDGHLIELVAPS
ncbi:VOC family protein [Pseudonocardia sp. GCM10023141]|uniref:VOC family protein n=1 Tax=Pseudonocardia sp. GCM10023141 TaxID=3252653 RepID=UPI003605D6E7